MEKKTHVIVASLILSILLWLSVSMNDEYTVNMRVPLKVSDLPGNVALASPIPRTVLVRVRGTGWQLASSYLSSTSSINLDIPNFDRRRIVFTGSELGYSLELGSAAQVLGFTPDSIVVTLDKIISKRVPIVPKVSIQPHAGYMVVGTTTITPDSVTVSGALRLLMNLDAWYTQERQFKNVMNEIDITLPLSDTLAGITKLDSRSIRFTSDVEQIAENTYKDIRIKILNEHDSSKILLLPPTVNVTLRGGLGIMAQVTADSLNAAVDYESLVRSLSGYFIPSIGTPDDLQVISVQPDSVQFVIRK